MTLKEFIEELTDIASEVGEEVEVVATNNESGETYTPVISVGTDRDGVRRLRVC
jgi:hypothetical protein